MEMNIKFEYPISCLKALNFVQMETPDLELYRTNFVAGNGESVLNMSHIVCLFENDAVWKLEIENQCDVGSGQ